MATEEPLEPLEKKDDTDKNPAKRKESSHGGISDRTANLIIGVVTVMWAVNILAGMARFNGYQPSESINGIFMAIVGGAFVVRARKTPGDGE